MSDDGNVIFSEISSDVISLVPQADAQKSTRTVDVQTGTDEIESKETGTDSIAILDQATQTEFVSNTTVNDERLAEWLKKILPLVEEELSMGTTKLFDAAANENETFEITKYQTISMLDRAESSDSNKPDDDSEIKNCALSWLSLSTEIYPFLAISFYPSHTSWCEHENPEIRIFGPQTLVHTKKYYKQLTEIPVKSCVTLLSTNPYSKDIFVGSSIAGDLYIWEYNSSVNEVKELFCEPYQYGSVIGFVWMKSNLISSEVNLLSCHQDGSIVLWKIGKVLAKDKVFKINHREKSTLIELTAAVGLTGFEFVLGSNDGKLYLCSASQLLPIRGGQANLFDPVINELESHKFSISSLAVTNFNGKRLLVSCDMSGEVFLHDIENSKLDESTPVIMKLPLPFKSRIVCTKNLTHILSPGINGTLEIYRVANGELTSLDGDLKGKGNLISLSNTEHLLVAGVYNNDLQIYKIENN